MNGKLMFVALVIMITIVACGTPAEDAGSRDPTSPDQSVVTSAAPGGTTQTPQLIDAVFQDTRWTLVSLNGKAVLGSSNITLNFDNGQVGGYAGCNWYGSGDILASEGRLAISEISSTERGCLDEQVQKQEEVYQQVLRQASRYQIRNDLLELMDAAGRTTLVFSLRPRYDMDPAALVGTQWVLQSLNGATALPGSTITITFTNGEARGSAGCRSYLSTYEAEGDTIHFTSTSMLEHDCMKSRLYLEQEGQYTDSLSGATDYRLSSDRLEITNVEGVLVFVPLSPDSTVAPTQTVWTLQHFFQGGTTTPVPATTTITLTFDGDTLRAQGHVGGSSGCNTYRATYSSVNELSVAAPTSTKLACQPQGIMEQEQRFIEWLRDVTVYHLDNDQLRRETADGRVLVFNPSPISQSHR